MEGFLHHMAPQFLHPALQGFGCGAFRPIGGAFHPLYPGKAFARHLGEQYALGQSVGQALRGVREDSGTPPPPLYRHTYSLRDDTSSPGSAASASPRPCKDDDPAPAAGPTATATATATCSDSHDLGGRAQVVLRRVRHAAGPRRSAGSLPPGAAAPVQPECAATYQRIRANRQRRLKLRTRKRHHTVESMLGYDLDDDRRDEHPRDSRSYDAEDEPVDVEGDSLGWPEAAINIDDKDQRSEVDKIHLNYSEDLEISSTNDAMQSPERVSSVPRIETPKPLSLDTKTEVVERPSEVTTSEWSASDTWPALPEGYSHIRHKIDGEVPSSSDSRN
ncbi:unnamed protein product [Leptidea sinapis]|uniref:E3 ubiquitin-protein ligase RNF220 middle domain-containing protein n=1 Tax=Leptidea sinapis TaxID=189913 RepID=A0A5E4R549_9NEOP|nr:unnamed protein product [Leptidea sinapis]